MKVTVLGAGPAGLYLGILLKKADPAHEVTIVERNAPGATFGWGVVFSEETLGSLRDADNPTYLEITDTFARWDAVDIRFRGILQRCRGHGFSAIARRELLAVLQRRCGQLGVTLRFETEVADPAELAADCDLLVGADGVNSVLRSAAAEEFGTSVETVGCKYIWYGTDLVLDAFRFIFTGTEHGLVQVHSYPFDENTSTFIVECPEPTWRALGLDTMSDDESISFCEELFAEDLAGHRLMSNRSAWLDFPHIRNRNWHSGNRVLLGDAAHTAHFSIGSGTKLAMEDAIALAGALSRGDDLTAALVRYQAERAPVVERFQQAAADSAAYFARVRHHTHLDPSVFAVNLLTRSGRISHGNLTLRDPHFMSASDGSFSGTGHRVPPPPALVPLKLGRLTVPNRIAEYAEPGVPLWVPAKFGGGLVFTSPVAVTDRGRINPDTPMLDHPWKAEVEAAHKAGAVTGILLTHAGARGATRTPERGIDIPLPAGQSWPLVAASAVRYAPRGQVPAELDADGLAEIRTAFATAAAKAAKAGFDVLQLDCAQGRLLAGFLSPLTNRRTDRYGGSPDNRLRFPLEVLAACREAWPKDRPISVRLTVDDWAPGGMTVDDGVTIARALSFGGVSLITVTAGQTIAESRPVYRRGFLTVLSDRIRSEARVPTMVGGHLTTADDVNTVLAAGRADLCQLDP
ncbi:FAD-dependent monooxygenase [Amycolatopsis suaedae]|uniref:Bifunctional salicylyl-CoA 5-hydroxylase/oxidoreductase n=1 Tax=Amycolatopsis suaedae TaxID=2510978 RepID=A0A4Q7IZU9_9PSEU|nr:FAD-dependent monooxygenase [Amycolatopsis suaedae]RZQ60600.1 hypothetical protein EWH70_28450 [Amycolatopsis suaedae]